MYRDGYLQNNTFVINFEFQFSWYNVESYYFAFVEWHLNNRVQSLLGSSKIDLIGIFRKVLKIVPKCIRHLEH
jgi:hypothetical protein